MKEKIKFNDENFINLLFTLLCKNGIYKVNQDDLAKKLFCFYQNKKYKEIFHGMKTSNQMVDLSNGIYQELTNSNNIILSKNTNNLYLNYDINLNLDSYKDKLSNEAILLMLKMAKVIAIDYKIEDYSNNSISIYRTNPNNNYALINGLYKGKKISSKIITDGNTKIMNKIRLENYRNNKRTSSLISDIKVTNASYTIIQKFENDKVSSINIYTNLDKFVELKEVSDIANKVKVKKK